MDEFLSLVLPEFIAPEDAPFLIEMPDISIVPVNEESTPGLPGTMICQTPGVILAEIQTPLIVQSLSLNYSWVFKGYALHGSQVHLRTFLDRSAYSLNSLALAIKPIRTTFMGYDYNWIDATFES
ncbi:uncharacterized protein ARMOST_17829 [Armillaria ostoyae]|uniref:Uncharacterized protein n=1 Tax=Armillaria ostoyae TaxID=47428 RepID=A0A284S037_ARMOS|nr:uncharacterized protein ARMOST_17829 [Armillaria ostoyae]